MAEIYTYERRVAVHEAGHAVMAYLVGEPFEVISVVPDDDSHGRVRYDAFPDWFQPDIEVTFRDHTLIENRVMVALAGAEAEGHWATRRVQGAPVDWQDHLKACEAHDVSNAVDLASYTCGSPEKTSAYIEHLRQKVLNHVGRWDTEGEDDPAGPQVVRFWRLADALANAVVEAKTLQWPQVHNVLQAADHGP